MKRIFPPTNVPSNDFTIVPIFMGASGAFYELHAVIGNEDYTIWEKHKDFEIKDQTNQEWHTTLKNTSFSQEWKNNSIDKDNNGKVTAIRAKKIEFNGFKEGEAMHFYLKAAPIIFLSLSLWHK